MSLWLFCCHCKGLVVVNILISQKSPELKQRNNPQSPDGKPREATVQIPQRHLDITYPDPWQKTWQSSLFPMEVTGRGFLVAKAEAKDIRDTSAMPKIHLWSPPTAAFRRQSPETWTRSRQAFLKYPDSSIPSLTGSCLVFFAPKQIYTIFSPCSLAPEILASFLQMCAERIEASLCALPFCSSLACQKADIP